MKAKKKLKKRLKSANEKKFRWFEFQDKAFRGYAIFSTGFGLLILALLIGSLFYEGWERLSWKFLTNGPDPLSAEESGIFPAWTGTLWIMVLTTLIAFPIGIGAAIYLEEYGKKSRFARIIEINIANLAGVPSIIYGLLGLTVFNRLMSLGGSVLTGALTLSLLILPVIIVSTREALRTVPNSIREASYALGATKLQTIWSQILPASLPGIFTGGILAISRAIGETAPLIVIGAVDQISDAPSGPMSSFTVLPMQIFNWVSIDDDFRKTAVSAIVVLLIITIVLNSIAIYLRQKWQKKVKW